MRWLDSIPDATGYTCTPEMVVHCEPGMLSMGLYSTATTTIGTRSMKPHLKPVCNGCAKWHNEDFQTVITKEMFVLLFFYSLIILERAGINWRSDSSSHWKKAYSWWWRQWWWLQLQQSGDKGADFTIIQSRLWQLLNAFQFKVTWWAGQQGHFPMDRTNNACNIRSEVSKNSSNDTQF